MQIFYSNNFLKDLTNSYIFVGNNTLVGGIAYPDLYGQLFTDLQLHNCTLLTIPSVTFEFLRGSDTRKKYNARAKYINNLVTVYPIEKHSKEFETLVVAMQRLGKSLQYTDFLLCACLYKFRQAYLLTENYTDMPIPIVERKHIATIDTGKQIRHQGVYQFSEGRFEEIAAKLVA